MVQKSDGGILGRKSNIHKEYKSRGGNMAACGDYLTDFADIYYKYGLMSPEMAQFKARYKLEEPQMVEFLEERFRHIIDVIKNLSTNQERVYKHKLYIKSLPKSKRKNIIKSSKDKLKK